MTITAPANTILLPPTASCAAVVEASHGDLRELDELIRRKSRPAHENVHDDPHLTELTPKPWKHQHDVLR